MNVPKGQCRELARGVIELEAAGGVGSDDLADAADRAFDRFHEHMNRLVGSTGFTALSRRALDRAAAEHAFLEGIAMPDQQRSGFDGLRDALRERDPDDARAAIESILAHFIDLLFRFLGGRLTARLLRNAWPGLETAGDPDRRMESPENS